MKKNYARIILLLKQELIRLSLVLACIGCALPLTTHAQLVNYTFTTGGATGPTGPSQGQLSAWYSSTNLNGFVTSLGGIQSFTVPVYGLYRITAIGAQGGYNGGYGASTTGEFNLAAGTVLKILVGQKGTGGTNTTVLYNAGGGGGGSYVISNANVPYVIAGGGGGNGDGYGPSPLPCCLSGMEAAVSTNGNPSPGGANNGTAGNGGTCGPNSSSAGAGAGFFTNGSLCQSATRAMGFVNGGAGGLPTVGSGTGGMGGFGGGGGTYDSNTGMRGGGGGGYSGGGGGTTPSFTEANASAGGGGSYNIGNNQVNVNAPTGGDGKVIISLICDVNITASGPNSLAPLICSGNSLTLTTNAVSDFTWSTGNSTSTSVVVAPTANTTYSITGARASGCASGAFINVTVSTGVPTLAITSSTPSTCLGNTVALSVSGALTYTWSNSVANGVPFVPNATATYTAMGTNGCGTTSALTTVSISPLPVTASASSTLICAGDIVTLVPGGATSYTWVPGPSTAVNFIVSPLSSLVYTVTGKTGSCSATATIGVNTNAVPTMTIVPSSSTICNGNTVNLTVSGDAVTYTWSPGGQTGNSISVNPGNSIIYSVQGTDAMNCSDVASQLIIVSQVPFINAITSHSVVCVGGTATLTASGAVTYTWSTAENTSVTVVSPVATSNYIVSGTSSLGCISSTFATISLFQPTVSVTGNTAVCLGSNTMLGAGGANTYTWANVNAVSQFINVAPTINTTYTVNASVSHSSGVLSCPATNTIALVVNPLPVITASGNHTIICIGQSAFLLVDGAGAAGSYTWANGLGNSTITLVAPIANQVYSVTGTDAHGCKNTSIYELLVDPCLGIHNATANSVNLTIYPNPASGEFTISSDEPVSLYLINELGQMIQHITLNLITPAIKISGLANGVYFVTGKNAHGSVNRKIIVTD